MSIIDRRSLPKKRIMEMEGDISFVGLGQMGFPMAKNLRRKMSKSATMFIHDVNSDACDRFKRETTEFGPVEILRTAKDVASKCPVLLSIVPASQHVRQVYLNRENGVIAAPKDDKRLMLECSTIDADTTREVGKAVMDAGLGRYIDAPVSGGVWGAAAGTLAFMVGCPESDPEAGRVRSIVSAMGNLEKVFFCGQLGTGNAAKISNNYMSGTILMALSEAMAIGIRSGVDKKVLAEVIRNSSGHTWTADHMNPVPGIIPTAPSSNGYKPGFRHEYMVKDMSLGIDGGEKVGIDATMAKMAVEAYKKGTKDPRCEGKDCSSVYLLVTDDQTTPQA